MLNQLTLKDYEKRIRNFNFEELVAAEAMADIAKTVFQKVRKAPVQSEFYVKIVLANVCTAYQT